MNGNSGALRHCLTLQRRVQASDGAGGFVTSWTPVTNPAVYAAIHAGGGGERSSAGRYTGVVMYRLTLRYRDDITADMRLTDGTRHYDITAVLDRDGRRQYLEVMATSEG